jgi:two-component system nitrate/nitrite response regulator NarL
MSTGIPAVVMHPCTLFRDGLRQILASTQFRPVHLAADIDEAAIGNLCTAETLLWLLGLEKCNQSTYDLVRRVCASNPAVRTVILAERQSAEDVWPAIEAGARGFLCQDISSERLIVSLELIALGEIIVPFNFLQALGRPLVMPVRHEASAREAQQMVALAPIPGSLANGKKPLSNGESSALVKGLSRRERSILRLLMQGASNNDIALRLVCTESTVKVQVKAILRKLRLHNRTEAAMWAFQHLGRQGA